MRTTQSICLLLMLIFTVSLLLKPAHNNELSKNDAISLDYSIQKNKYQEPIDPVEFWTVLGTICILVPIGGIFAGLTIGLMSLDETNLNILKRSGTPTEKLYAQRIEPIRKNTHLLLVTLLLGNTVINESLPVLFHSIRLDGYQAVLISTALILFFGEVIPQAICARHALVIGAFFAWPVRIFMWLIFVFAYPIAKLLDWILGTHEGVIYRRAELRELVAMHGEGPGGTLTKDEVGVLKAVLEIRDKSVKNVMTKMEDVFMLPFNAKITMDLLVQINKYGHSRIPIFKGSRENIIGVILVKQLLLCDPSKETPIFELKIRKLPYVRHNTPLFEILHIFEEGGSHMALVVEETEKQVRTPTGISSYPSIMASPLWTTKAPSPSAKLKTFHPLGIITLEDVIEELLGQEIIDETDEYVDIGSKVRVARAFRDFEKKISSTRLSERRHSFTMTDVIQETENAAYNTDSYSNESNERAPLLNEIQIALNSPIYQETSSILGKPSCSFDGGSSMDKSRDSSRKLLKKRKDDSFVVDAKDMEIPFETVLYGAEGRNELVSIPLPSSLLDDINRNDINNKRLH